MDDELKIKKDWAAAGFSCDLWIDPPGQTWEDYVHDVDERIFVLTGMMEFEFDGVKHILQPGDELFIPAWKKHSARNIGKSESQWLYGYKR